jgi:hypothetical protein
MTAPTTTTSSPSVSAPTLALVSAAAAAAFIIDALLGMAIPALAYDAPPVLWDAVLRAVLHLGQLAAAVAVSRAGLAGNGIYARIGLVLWILGSIAFAIGELVYLVARGPSDMVFQVGSVAMLVGMVMVGVGVLRARRWTGPGRFPPLITGLYIVPLSDSDHHHWYRPSALAGYSVLWMLLGLSLYFVTHASLLVKARL